MSRRRVVEVVAGARPNLVKIAALWRAFARRSTEACELRLVDTGQHYAPELSARFASELGLPPPAVGLGAGSGSQGAQTAAILERYEAHLLALPEPPAAVVVVGDVNSTMACALAAVKLELPVVHVEAGLRSFDRSMPEEINRVVTDAVSELLLASEPRAVDNLRAEGVDARRVHLVGSLIVDTLLHELPAARALSVPRRLGVEPRRYVLVTLHRPSNVDDSPRLRELAAAVCRVAERVPVVFPTHPRTAKRLEETGLADQLRSARVMLLSPLGYRDAIGLMSEAALVITDSGGIQEETSQLGVACLTLRGSTERPATLELGTNVLVDDPAALAPLALDALGKRAVDPAGIPGWDGRAAERAVELVLAMLA